LKTTTNLKKIDKLKIEKKTHEVQCFFWNDTMRQIPVNVNSEAVIMDRKRAHFNQKYNSSEIGRVELLGSSTSSSWAR